MNCLGEHFSHKDQTRAHICPHPWLSGSWALGQYSPALITSGSGTRQFRIALTPQSLPKVFMLSRLKPAAYPALVPFIRNRNKGSCLCFHHAPSTSWPILVLPCIALCGIAWELILSINLAGAWCPNMWSNILDRTSINICGICNIYVRDKPSLQWSLSPEL